jgi:hypothetical protein
MKHFPRGIILFQVQFNWEKTQKVLCAHTAHMDIFQHLVVDLDTEGEREREGMGGPCI